MKEVIPWIPEELRTETVEMEDTFLKSADQKTERKLRKRVRSAVCAVV